MFKSFTRIKNAIRPGLHQTDLSSMLTDLTDENLYSVRVDAFKGILQWLRLPIAGKEDSRTTLVW